MLHAFLCLAGLAAANGANDVSRAAATLVGGRVSAYRAAMRWTVAWTLAGSALSGWLAAGVARRFAAGLGTNPVHLALAVPAVLLGSVAWIAISTFRRLPVATTHALVGALLGVTWMAGGWAACHRINLAQGFFLPLLASPVIAAACAIVLRKLLPAALDRYPKPLNCAHWVSAGCTALSRGINDSAKIWAILLPLGVVMGTSPVLFARLTQITVALAMLTGSLLAGRRVTENLAFGVLPMSSKDSVVANIVTASVIISASLLSFPVASSHVVSGAILGVGLAANRRSLQWRTIAEIALAWLVTLPAAAIFSMSLYVGFGRARTFARVPLSGDSMTAFAALLLAVLLLASALLLWTQSRSQRANAAMPLPERLIVFICNSNTSRSPMAAQMCTALLARMRSLRPPHLADSICVISRGISAVEGQEMAPLAMDALRNFDYAPVSHSASNLTLETVDRAHLVFCMTDDQVAQVKQRFPSSSAKTLRLHPEIDIPNPAGKGLIDFEYVADLLRKAIDQRIGLITSA